MNHGTARCISLGNRSADAAVGTEVLRVLAPLGMDAALKVLDAQTSETSATERQLELALAQARYEVAHARRQYDAVDPANRLVAGELERRWNEALAAVTPRRRRHCCRGCAKTTATRRDRAQAADRTRRRPGARMVAPGCNSGHPQADTAHSAPRDRGEEQGPVVDLVLHWQGGDHTALQLKLRLNAAGRHHSRVPEERLIPLGPAIGQERISRP